MTAKEKRDLYWFLLAIGALVTMYLFVPLRPVDWVAGLVGLPPAPLLPLIGGHYPDAAAVIIGTVAGICFRWRRIMF